MQEPSWRHRQMSDNQWIKLLQASVTRPVIGGLTFPRFPPEKIQANFVGSSFEKALEEAGHFYKLVKSASRAMGNKLERDSTFVDFGCGWGRYLRLFWRDVRPENLYGVDVDPDILKMCTDAGVPGKLSRIDNIGTLPFADRSVSHLMAYSVFTHLPEHVHMHWIAEIARVMKPGGSFVLTTEPRRFLDFIATIPENATSVWHAQLRTAAGDLDAKRQAFDDGQFVYLPTGGGDYRQADVYGDAVVPRSYLERSWKPWFEVVDYIDDPKRFWQAAVVARRL